MKMADFDVSLSDDSADGNDGNIVEGSAAFVGLPQPQCAQVRPNCWNELECSLKERLNGLGNASDVSVLIELVLTLLKQDVDKRTLCSELRPFLHNECDEIVAWICEHFSVADPLVGVAQSQDVCDASAKAPPTPWKAAPWKRRVAGGPGLVSIAPSPRNPLNPPPPPRLAADEVPSEPTSSASALSSSGMTSPVVAISCFVDRGSRPRSRSKRPRIRSEATVEEDTQEHISRRLSSVLRHRALELGIGISQDGFASLEQVSRAVRQSVEVVRRVIGKSFDSVGMPRFEMRELDGCGPEVRSIRGHSMNGLHVHGSLQAPAISAPSRRAATMDLPEVARISRALSKILRHSAVSEGVAIKPDGFAPVDGVLQALRRHRGLSRADVVNVVRTSTQDDGAPRFELQQIGNTLWIRALKRHSILGVEVAPVV